MLPLLNAKGREIDLSISNQSLNAIRAQIERKKAKATCVVSRLSCCKLNEPDENSNNNPETLAECGVPI